MDCRELQPPRVFGGEQIYHFFEVNLNLIVYLAIVVPRTALYTWPLHTLLYVYSRLE